MGSKFFKIFKENLITLRLLQSNILLKILNKEEDHLLLNYFS